MHKINLKKPLLLLNGTPAMDAGKELILSETIAECLIQSQSDDPLKMNSICRRLYAKGEIELDASDLELFKNAVKSNRMATDLLRGTVLEEIARQMK